MIYIHYGSDHFHPELFMPIRNSSYFSTKPEPGTGLWASRENDENGWKAWCRINHFQTEALDQYFRFELIGAKILTLTDTRQLVDLPLLSPWQPKELPEVDEGSLPTMEQLKSWFMPNLCYIDFERLAKEYDAVELRNSALFSDALYMWDCDSVLVLRSEKLIKV